MMDKTLEKEILETMAVISAIVDILKLDVENISSNVGYYSPNLNRLNSLILESKRGINNLKALLERKKMEFDSENQAEKPVPEQEPDKGQPQGQDPEESGSGQQDPEVDEFGVSVRIDGEIREELHKVLYALNNVAAYAMDQITVSTRVFAKYMAQLYNVKPKVMFKQIMDDMAEESKVLQKMREREAGISDAQQVQRTNGGNDGRQQY